MVKKPELLAPAGDLEKLKIAVLYGADAVYIGGERFSLRAKAKNFNMDEMKEGIDFAHSYNCKVYVTANIIAHNEDFEGMGEYFKQLEQIGADAILIADPGVFQVAKEYVPNMQIHLSTQANNTNYKSANFWYSLGVKRIVLARELSLKEIKQIRQNINDEMEIETFVHGAMCISYSGRCLLSNYMTSRDANRGECSHPCRWKYYLVEEKRPNEYMPVIEDEKGTYIYNSKDLCMINHIPDLIDAGVESFKLEGRMKTVFYVGTIVKAYRQAIDDYFNNPQIYQSKLDYYIQEVSKASHREYTTGFYYGKPSGNEQIYTNNSYIRTYEFIGIVLDYDKETKIATIEQRNKFSVREQIEIMQPNGYFKQTITEMYNEDGNKIESAPHPKQIVKIKLENCANKFDILIREEKVERK